MFELTSSPRNCSRTSAFATLCMHVLLHEVCFRDSGEIEFADVVFFFLQKGSVCPQQLLDWWLTFSWVAVVLRYIYTWWRPTFPTVSVLTHVIYELIYKVYILGTKVVYVQVYHVVIKWWKCVINCDPFFTAANPDICFLSVQSFLPCICSTKQFHAIFNISRSSCATYCVFIPAESRSSGLLVLQLSFWYISVVVMLTSCCSLFSTLVQTTHILHISLFQL